jgi:branched-chain amino acid transport system ATP-binding protein
MASDVNKPSGTPTGNMLDVQDLHAYYGKSHILHGVHLSVGEGEIVSLLGRNGVGRSTTCKAIMGLVEPQGSVKFRGKELAGMRTDLISQTGIGYVPEDRQVFPTLTVRQNLELGLRKSGVFGRWTFDDVFKLFPNLDNRQNNAAGVLSGGEQQMLTMCRTLMGDPDLILIDEPTEGLAPRLVEQVGVLLEEIAKRGISILLARSCSRARRPIWMRMPPCGRNGWRSEPGYPAHAARLKNHKPAQTPPFFPG